MNNSSFRRSASLIRTTLVLLAFTALAAVGFAATKSIRPALTPTTTSLHAAPAPTGAASARMPQVAPAACPIPAGAFHAR